MKHPSRGAFRSFRSWGVGRHMGDFDRVRLGLSAGDNGDASPGFAVVVEGDTTVVDDVSGALEGDGRLVGRDRLLPIDDTEVARVADSVVSDSHEDSRPVIADIDDFVDNTFAQ